VCMYVHIHVIMYVYMHVCMYVCVCVRVFECKFSEASGGCTVVCVQRIRTRMCGCATRMCMRICVCVWKRENTREKRLRNPIRHQQIQIREVI